MASQLQTTVFENPWRVSTAAVVVTSAAIAYADYRHYISFGPHGLPDNFWGWYKQLRMSTKARKDVTKPAPYDINAVAGPHDRKSYLNTDAPSKLEPRPGNKAPEIPNFVAPQRQTTQQASEATKKAMFAYLDTVASSHPSVLQIQDSVLEGPVPALGVKDFASRSETDKPGVLRATRGEMCHIHPPDGSTHLILSLEDSRKIIELGWGRRHRLSGGGLLPWNYTLLYAPRDEAEFEIWKSVVEAGVGFCMAHMQ